MKMVQTLVRPVLWLSLALVATLSISVQSTFAQQKEAFEFGPPLRGNSLFAYKYTERVRINHVVEGKATDSSERLLAYFVTQHQVPNPDGSWKIEANIDSMQLVYTRPNDTILFDSQKLTDRDFDITHREILGPSSLVNRLVTFTLSPYGEIISVMSPGLEDIRVQAADPSVDPVTRARINDISMSDYVTSVILPWRGVMPMGRKMNFGDSLTMDLGTALDRIPFHEKALVKLTNAQDKPTISFASSFTKPLIANASYTELLDPVSIVSVRGRVNGLLNLDRDGVVLSGWTSAKGVVDGKRDGATVVTTITHETFTEMLGTSPFAAN